MKTHSHLKLRISIIEAIARIQLDPGFFPFGVFENEYVKKFLEMSEYMIEYTLSTVLAEMLPKVIVSYFDYLKENFSDTFRDQVTRLINTILENSKEAFVLLS